MFWPCGKVYYESKEKQMRLLLKIGFYDCRTLDKLLLFFNNNYYYYIEKAGGWATWLYLKKIYKNRSLQCRNSDRSLEYAFTSNSLVFISAEKKTWEVVRRSETGSRFWSSYEGGVLDARSSVGGRGTHCTGTSRRHA